MTYYGTEEDGLLGEKHGAAWNGLRCWMPGAAAPMPDVVTSVDMGGAMPGVEYYCKPILVCVGSKCEVFVAVDVPAKYKVYGKRHMDVWPAVAQKLGIADVGVCQENVRVYVGGGR